MTEADRTAELDVAIVGAGPNGLAAAVVLARAGLQVEVFEANATIGGGARSDTVDGVVLDWGSAVHPMALASPFLRRFGLAERLSFVTPDASYAHPLDEGAVVAWRDIERMPESLGDAHARAWQRLLAPLAARIDDLADTLLGGMMRVPPHPALLAGFGMRVLAHGVPLGSREPGARAVGDRGRAALAGVFAHAVSPLPRPSAAAAGLVLAAAAHARGWPIPVGGTRRIADALRDDLVAHGGRVHTGRRIRRVEELPVSRALLFDTAPDVLLEIAGDRLHPGYARALRHYRFGDAASRVDFVLNAPVPWRDVDVAHAGTLHLGGSADEIAAAEIAVRRGIHPDRPYVLASQPTLFDATRAPAGTHLLWTYAHVPAGSTRDMTAQITAQIERFAPGFRDTVVGTRVITAADLERGDANLRGGDIATGRADLRGLLARPVLSRSPWRAGVGVYLCSAATPPGPGVHGMGGYHAAVLALREVFGIAQVPDLAP